MNCPEFGINDLSVVMNLSLSELIVRVCVIGLEVRPGLRVLVYVEVGVFAEVIILRGFVSHYLI